MTTVRVTRVVTFSAAHRYHRPDWSAERNARVFGACAHEHGHGHTYRCHVTVRGAPDGETGMVMDLHELDRVLRDEVTARLDHRHINLDVREFAYGARIPTSEELAVFIWERVAPCLPAGVRLERVRVEEDPTLYAEYAGPNDD
jgi:6-pyruvoyltetrahydropterin/6-carboxytetrahydropterin synthase